MTFKTLILASAFVGVMAAPAFAGNVNNINLGANIGQTVTDTQAMVAGAAAHADTSYGWANKVDANALGANIGADASAVDSMVNNGNDQNWQAGIAATVGVTQSAALTGQTAAADALSESPSGATDVTAEATALNAGAISSITNSMNFNIANPSP
jgi:hypothetical protein